MLIISLCGCLYLFFRLQLLHLRERDSFYSTLLKYYREKDLQLTELFSKRFDEPTNLDTIKIKKKDNVIKLYGILENILKVIKRIEIAYKGEKVDTDAFIKNIKDFHIQHNQIRDFLKDRCLPYGTEISKSLEQSDYIIEEMQKVIFSKATDIETDTKNLDNIIDSLRIYQKNLEEITKLS